MSTYKADSRSSQVEVAAAAAAAAPATSSTTQSSCGDDVLDFVVYRALPRIPLFFLRIDTALAIENPSSRAAADDKMILGLRELFDDQSMSGLYGISALGTRLSFYCLDTGINAESVTPPFRVIPRNPAAASYTYANNVAPAHLWGTDILTDDGYDRFMGFVQHIKALAVTTTGHRLALL